MDPGSPTLREDFSPFEPQEKPISYIRLQCERPGSIPGLRRSPEEGNGYPIYTMDQKSPVKFTFLKKTLQFINFPRSPKPYLLTTKLLIMLNCTAPILS